MTHLGAPGSQREYNYLRFPNGLPPIEYEHIVGLITTLENFCFKEVPEVLNKDGTEKTKYRPAGPGANEQYIESLQLFFPVHNQEELSWLRNRWGSWNQLWAQSFRSKEVEGADTPCWNIMDDAPDDAEFDPNAHYNVPTVRWGCVYQPLDEIRDYFGDDNAIYFSWLATYTKALGIAGVFGTVTMIFQFWQPKALVGDTEVNGVDGNPLTLVYSIFMSIWSVVFLSVWRRKEAEHSFLWGSEGFEDSEPARPEFKGKLVVNPETGREDLVINNYPLLVLKKCFSYVVILMCMFTTVYSAFQAMSLKNLSPKECIDTLDSVVTHDKLGCAAGTTGHLVPGRDDGFDAECCYDLKDLCYIAHGCGGPQEVNALCPNGTAVEDFCGPRQSVEFQSLTMSYKMKWKLLSAGANLFIIQTAGFIYEGIADALNNMENFRTDTEHSDGLIIKNFLFQFVNNYFVLFYIAYARQIDVGDIPGKQCPQSCLPEIQIQMLVVFSAKTFGLQAVELAKPFAMKYIKVVMEMKHMKSLIAATEEGISSVSNLATETAAGAASLALTVSCARCIN